MVCDSSTISVALLPFELRIEHSLLAGTFCLFVLYFINSLIIILVACFIVLLMAITF